MLKATLLAKAASADPRLNAALQTRWPEARANTVDGLRLDLAGDPPGETLLANQVIRTTSVASDEIDRILVRNPAALYGFP